MVVIEIEESEEQEALRSPTQPLIHGPTPEDVDSILAKEMSKLSVKERELVLYDVHGVVSERNREDHIFIADRMREMEEHIETIENKPAYQRASAMYPEYVHNSRFRLAFLRADNYNAQEAAVRLVRHFEMKAYLFGDDKLGKNIKLEDLNDLDLLSLEKGSLRMAPGRDRSGRLVAYFRFPVLLPGITFKNTLRSMWYFCCVNGVENEEAQLNGIVVIAQNTDSLAAPAMVVMKMKSKMLDCVPIRISSMHYCLNDPRFVGTTMLSRTMLHRNLLLRSRYHFGPNIELQSFGIPPPFVAWSSNEQVLANHAEWIRIRKYSEQLLLCNGGSVMKPTRFDVLFGRGRSRNHPGNLRVQYIVEQFRSRYEAAGRREKTAISDEILDTVHRSSGRFLKLDEDGNGWIEVSQPVAREKISKFFRKIRSEVRRTNAKIEA